MASSENESGSLVKTIDEDYKEIYCPVVSVMPEDKPYQIIYVGGEWEKFYQCDGCGIYTESMSEVNPLCFNCGKRAQTLEEHINAWQKENNLQYGMPDSRPPTWIQHGLRRYEVIETFDKTGLFARIEAYLTGAQPTYTKMTGYIFLRKADA